MLSHLHIVMRQSQARNVRQDSESKESLESHFDTSDSNTESSLWDSKTITESNSIDSESRQFTQSTTPKNPSEALLNTNNSACASTMPKRNCKIAPSLQSKNQIKCVASAHTVSRPLRGVQSLRKGGSSASATIALEAEKRGTPAKRYTLWLPKRPNGLQAKRSKNSGALFFFGALGAGRG